MTLALIVCLFATQAAPQQLMPGVPGVNGRVDALVLVGNTLYLGGAFTEVGGQSRQNLAAVDLSTLHVTDWQPSVTGLVGTEVLSLVTDGNTLFVGGPFDHVAGQPRNGLAAISVASGALLPFDAHLNQGDGAVPEVWTMTLSGGTLRIGGAFSNLGGVARSNVAAVDAASGALSAWAPEANSVVRGMAETPSGVFLDGIFNNVGGQPRALLAQVDAETGAATSWLPPAFSGAYRSNGVYQNPALYSLAVDGDRLYVGGQFAGPRANAACVDVATGAVQPWSPPGNMIAQPVEAGAFALLPGPGIVYVGEVLTNTNGLMALDATTGNAVPSSPPYTEAVRAILNWGPNVVFAGQFTDVGGTPAGNLALWLDPSVLDASDGTQAPLRLALSPPSPLPARTTSHVTLSLPRAARVSAGLIDVTGRIARTVLDDRLYPAGRHDLTIELSGLAPSVYWLSVNAGGERAGRKLVVSR